MARGAQTRKEHEPSFEMFAPRGNSAAKDCVILACSILPFYAQGHFCNKNFAKGSAGPRRVISGECGQHAERIADAQLSFVSAPLFWPDLKELVWMLCVSIRGVAPLKRHENASLKACADYVPFARLERPFDGSLAKLKVRAGSDELLPVWLWKAQWLLLA